MLINDRGINEKHPVFTGQKVTLLQNGTAVLRLEEMLFRQVMEGVVFGPNHELEIGVAKAGGQRRLSGVQNAHDGALIRVAAIFWMLKAIHQVDLAFDRFHDVQNGDGFGGAGQSDAATGTGHGFQQSGL